MNSELKDAIKNSGNNLHLTVVDILEKVGWETDISPYYCDDLTDRPREIDILATSRRSMSFPNSKKENDFYNVVLCIECKHFTQDICFRVFDNNKDIGKRVLSTQKHNLDIKEAIRMHGRLFDSHHYLSQPKIAKLYEYPKKNQGGKNQEDDVFQAITQSVKSTIFFMNSVQKGVLGSIFYPVVVYDNIDGLYFMQENRASDDQYLDNLEKRKSVIFHLKYSFPNYDVKDTPRYATKDFYVDFIHKDELEHFVTDTIIEKECVKILDPVLYDVYIAGK